MSAHNVTTATAQPRRLIFQRCHGRVQDYRDEGRHDDQEDDVLEPVDDLPEQVDRDHHADRRQDGRQRDTPGLCGDPQAAPPGRRWHIGGHLAIIAAARARS
jgi:hypothetical protein